jgi:DNA-binding transcriptional MocR family regulator
MASSTPDLAIPTPLYEQAAQLAADLQISTNDLLAVAVAEYLRRHHNQKLLHSLNDAYSDGLDTSEQTMLEAMRHHQRQLASQETEAE